MGHYIAILCLLMSAIYCILLFIESHNDTLLIPFLSSCITTQRIHLISLVIVKYFTTWIFIFNLSYMNQSPFFNPRYKYISKKRRMFLHYLFLSFKWIIGIFVPIGIYSAYNRADCNSFYSAPNNFKYCYMTFNIRNFLIIFSTDILGIILYGLLFGRNACKLTQRKIKKHKKQKDVNPNELMHASQYDLDDPIQKSLILNAEHKFIVNQLQKNNEQKSNQAKSDAALLLSKSDNDDSHSPTNSSSDNQNFRKLTESRRGSLSASG